MASELESRSGPSDPLLPDASACHRRPTTGGWRSALFIIWVEVAERFTYYGVSANLINYLTGPLGETTAAAAAAMNAWCGAASVLPLLGAAVADSWLGWEYLVFTALIQVLNLVKRQGLGLLALSSMFSSPQSQQCSSSGDGRRVCQSSSVQTVFFYVSLYLVAIAQSGHKPCVKAFGADQFDTTDPRESLSRSSFFNWWYLAISLSAAVTTVLMSYVQDNIGWVLGFGVPCMVMLLALVVFLLGTRTYRFYDGGSGGAHGEMAGTFSGVGKAVRAWRKRWREGGGSGELEGLEHGESAESAVLAEEVRGVARLFPIWVTCLVYGVVFAQRPTLFTKQVATLDRRIGTSSFQVPAAALQSLIVVSIVPCILLYDRVLVPVARRITGATSGITLLQRIGAGIALSMVTLVVAELVEMKRLSTARDAGVVDKPGAVVPMSLWWIMPQYLLIGAADVFAVVGMQEFFYDQVPSELRSLGRCDIQSCQPGPNWFNDNLNRGHVDYFCLLLAALTVLELLAYIYFSTSYIYRRRVVNIH